MSDLQNSPGPRQVSRRIQTAELHRLLDELITASAIEAGTSYRSGAEFEQFKRLDDRVSAIAQRIERILG